MVKPSRIRARIGHRRHPALLCVGVLSCLLVGCTSVVELEDDASTGEPDPAGTTTTGPSATTADPSGAGVTTGSESTGAASSTTDDPAGNQYLIDPDGGDVSIECSLFEQDCPRGEKCNIWANDGGSVWNATRCVPVDRAPDGPAELCTVEESGVSGVDSCDVGAVCWNVDETGEGTCVSFCAGSEDAPICEGTLRCTAREIFALCLPGCDPLLQDCGEGGACYVFDDTTECASDASGDSGSTFDTCAFLNACDPGLNCTDAAIVGLCEAGAEDCCTPFCDLQAPTCPEGTQCISAFGKGMAPPGYEDVGICGQGPE